MIAVIDNYDSFTYNLVQYLGEVSGNDDCEVYRNDQITPDELRSMEPEHIVISPGPCTPDEAGISMAVAREFAGQVPVLGVCLGHQAIAQAFGGTVVLADDVVHGKTSRITHDGRGIFSGVEPDFVATRYHSLIVDERSLPADIVIQARSEHGEIMALTHRKYPTLVGVQFHPESVLTKMGKQLLRNFLALSRARS